MSACCSDWYPERACSSSSCNPKRTGAVQRVLESEKHHERKIVISAPAFFLGKCFRVNLPGLGSACGILICLTLMLVFSVSSSAQVPAAADSGATEPGAEQLPGTIRGTVVDSTDAAIAGAEVTLTRGDESPKETQSAPDGSFSFESVAPGAFTVTITATGFTSQRYSGTVSPGQVDVVSPIMLALATNITEVKVVAPSTEVAEEQVKIEEKQRVLGVIPNFYVTYIPDAAPLDAKQKFGLAWKSTIDPVTIGITAGVAGFEQGDDQFNGYGQGAEGYFKRFGAIYADTVTGTFIGGAILPTLLKQDPRYFYKGTGTVHSRVLYAIVNAVICKGDNKRWQPNYSSIGGSLAAGGIANLYYPAQNRGVALTFENALITIGESAAGNLFEEFLSRKLTLNILKHSPTKS